MQISNHRVKKTWLTEHEVTEILMDMMTESPFDRPKLITKRINKALNDKFKVSEIILEK